MYSITNMIYETYIKILSLTLVNSKTILIIEPLYSHASGRWKKSGVVKHIWREKGTHYPFWDQVQISEHP